MQPPKRRTAPPSRPDPNETWQRAVSAMHAGRFTEAQEAAELVALRFPSNVEVQHFIALAIFRQGKRTEAVERMTRVCAGKQTGIAACQDYGNMLREIGRLTEAEAAYRRCLELSPQLADLWENLATLQFDQDRHSDAQQTIARAVSTGIRSVGLLRLLGQIEQRREAWVRAADVYRQALELDPTDAESHRQSVAVLRRAGLVELAAEAAARWSAAFPDDAVAKHMLSALSGCETLRRADEAYVKQVFDAFADSFDENLASLDYQTPRQTAEHVAIHLQEQPADSILDAGCGTGLCGRYLRSLTKRLIGVDLSPRMLTQAHATELYDELVEAELTAYLQQQTETFDWIVSADTLNYFGDLEPVFAAARSALKPRGRFIFTLEDGNRMVSEMDEYLLQTNGRYCHRSSAVNNKLLACGFEVTEQSALVLRMESGQPVHGFIFSALRSK